MRDTYVVKSDILKKYASNLAGEYTSFTNGSRKTFSNGYLYDCSDATIVSMRNNIDKLYSDIATGYTNIKKWLDDYIKDSEALEASLTSGKTTVSDSNTNSYVKTFVSKNNVKIEETTTKFKMDVDTTAGATTTELSKDEVYQTLNSLNDEEIKLVRVNLGLHEVGKANKSIDELKKELSAKTGEDYSNASNDQIVLLCTTNGIEIQRDKTREESIQEMMEKIGNDYSSFEQFVAEKSATGYSAYRTHEKGSMFDYSKINSLDDYEFNRLCKKLNINTSEKDMGYMEMIKALQDAGVDIHSGEKSSDELKQMCVERGIDVTGGKSRTELEELVRQKLENKEKNQYFGLTPTSEEEKRKYIELEGRVDYTKYESLSDEELIKLADSKGINTKIYTRNGLIKEVAEKEWNMYSTYGNGSRDLDMSAAVHNAWDEGYSSLEEQAAAARAKVEYNETMAREEEKYGISWGAFCRYQDTDGFYREYASAHNLSQDQVEELMRQGYKGVRDEKILAREVLGEDDRSFLQKVGGTALDFVIGVGEGVCGAVEAVGDGVVFLGAAAGGGVYSLFGGDFDDVMDPARKYIAEDHTGEIFDYVYEDTAIGQYAAENSVNHALVRGLGNSIGEVGVTAAGMASGLGLVSPFIIGFGNGIEDAYASGATGLKAVAGALMKGAYNTVQYGVGVKFATAAYTNAAEKVAVNVMVDVGDAATTNVIDSAIRTTYAKGYYDPNTGEFIEFTDDTSWGEKWLGLYKESGGIGGTMQNIVLGAGLSLLFNGFSERKNFGKQKADVDYKGHVVEDGIYSDGEVIGLEDSQMKAKRKAEYEADAKARAEADAKAKADDNMKYRTDGEQKADFDNKAKEENKFKQDQNQQKTDYDSKAKEENRFKQEQNNQQKADADSNAKFKEQSTSKENIEEKAFDKLNKMKMDGKSPGEIMSEIQRMYENGELGEGKSLYRKLVKKFHQDVDIGAEHRAADAQAKADADAKLKAEEELKARERAQAEAKAKAKAEAEAQARAKAEAEAKMRENNLKRNELREKLRKLGVKEEQLDGIIDGVPDADLDARIRDVDYKIRDQEIKARAEAEAKAKAKAEAEAKMRENNLKRNELREKLRKLGIEGEQLDGLVDGVPDADLDARIKDVDYMLKDQEIKARAEAEAKAKAKAEAEAKMRENNLKRNELREKLRKLGIEGEQLDALVDGVPDADLDARIKDVDYMLKNQDVRVQKEKARREELERKYGRETAQKIEYINNKTKAGEIVYIKETAFLSPDIIKELDNLDNVRIYVYSSWTDENGVFKQKYNKQKYADRVTYTGREMYHILKRLDQLESKIDMSLPPKQRAKQIYEIIANEYDYSYKSMKGPGHKVSSNLRGITDYNFLGEEGLVCAGYAALYKELCNRAGIKCDYIHGKGIDADGHGVPHAWNVVIIDGEVIPVDVTFRATGPGNWFGKSDEFAAQHVADVDEKYRDYK